MAERVHKLIELVGSSKKSFADAADQAVRKASKTLHGIGWLEVVQLRGRVADGKISEYQATIKVGFELD